MSSYSCISRVIVHYCVMGYEISEEGEITKQIVILDSREHVGNSSVFIPQILSTVVLDDINSKALTKELDLVYIPLDDIAYEGKGHHLKPHAFFNFKGRKNPYPSLYEGLIIPSTIPAKFPLGHGCVFQVRDVIQRLDPANPSLLRVQVILR